ncbi:MAG: ferredoxin [Actinomycetota bacterium]|jgi:ferredoxin|nr:ferredoxin [Actinomycetota bacterium]HQZ85169.1 ferredoxin [Actinomycetota bacterium]
MRIVHDESSCASLGMCEAVAPELFEIGADGFLTLLDPTPPESSRSQATQAALACPTGALRIED